MTFGLAESAVERVTDIFKRHLLLKKSLFMALEQKIRFVPARI